MVLGLCHIFPHTITEGPQPQSGLLLRKVRDLPHLERRSRTHLSKRRTLHCATTEQRSPEPNNTRLRISD